VKKQKISFEEAYLRVISEPLVLANTTDEERYIIQRGLCLLFEKSISSKKNFDKIRNMWRAKNNEHNCLRG